MIWAELRHWPRSHTGFEARLSGGVSQGEIGPNAPSVLRLTQLLKHGQQNQESEGKSHQSKLDCQEVHSSDSHRATWILQLVLPSSDEEEEGEDDEEGKSTHRCRDDDQHLALIRGDVWCWKEAEAEAGGGGGSVKREKSKNSIKWEKLNVRSTSG